MNLRDIPIPPSPHEKTRLHRRGRIIQIGVGLLFLMLLGRLWFLQIAEGERFAAAAQANATRLERKPGPRGDILDRNGVMLATTRPKFVVSVHPDEFNIEGPEGRKLAECLHLPMEELELRLNADEPNYKMVRVAVDVPWEVLARLKEMQPWLPGVSVELEQLRYYPQAKLGAHLLGTMGLIGEDLLRREPGIYYSESRVGKSGLEKQYEEVLRGEDGGLRIAVDASGNRIRMLSEDEPLKGSDLVLTINSKVQRAAEEALAGHVGSAVALDPRTGEVLALVSQPAYDPNLFARGIRAKEYQAILSDKRKPLLDRAVRAYPPASTFKIVTSLAGLVGGKITPGMSVYCTGRLGSRGPRCWSRHGYVTFDTAIAKSCDIFFYRVGQALGVDAIASMARRFGLGKETGIDLPGEHGGTIPSEEWKRKYVKRDPIWRPGETLSTAIGQGYVECTPLQIASVTGAVAMHGRRYRPHLVKSIKTATGIKHIQPELISTTGVPDEYYAKIVNALRLTVQAGTGRTAALPGIDIGGKTGTAEVTRGAPHAWFVSVAPLNNPQIVCAVLVEHGRHGATAAAPVAKAMMAAYFKVKSTPNQRVFGD